MVTGPCVVSRIKVFSVTAMLFALFQMDGSGGLRFSKWIAKGMSRDRTAHAVGRWHGRTAFQRLQCRWPPPDQQVSRDAPGCPPTRLKLTMAVMSMGPGRRGATCSGFDQSGQGPGVGYPRSTAA